ncbi:MAG: response regulator [Sneathiellales bacterium]|nr:response regulator [Sneathiellales bacterium]
MKYKEVTLLLVEDDEIDVMATKKALKDLRIGNPIHLAKNGLEALEAMRGENGVEKIPTPYIVLLDLNMPKMGGLEFLDIIRNDQDLKSTIVFVMTTSEAESDIWAAYDKNIAGYIVKSNTGDSFNAAMEMLEHYWKIVEIPADGQKTAFYN